MADENTETSVEKPDTHGLPGDFLADLDKAVNEVSAKVSESFEAEISAEPESEPEAKEPEADLIVEAEEADDDSGDSEPEGEPASSKEPEADAGLSDDVIERAVRAGLSLSEIKQYPNSNLLDRACARIEAAARAAGSPEDAGSEAESAAQSFDEVLGTIPDLDPETFDPELVSGLKSLKGIAKQQNDYIESLRREIESLREDRTGNWFDKKLDAVKKFTKNDADKVAAIRRKFDAFKTGYKASGSSVSDDVVFDEVAELVLGSEMRAARQKKQESVARKRNGQFMQRPSGKAGEAVTDPFAEAADFLDERFFNRR